MTRLERLHTWVHQNFLKYQLITKLPLVAAVLIIILIK